MPLESKTGHLFRHLGVGEGVTFAVGNQERVSFLPSQMRRWHLFFCLKAGEGVNFAVSRQERVSLLRLKAREGITVAA